MSDAIFLGVLALLDLGFLVYLRLRRSRRKRKERLGGVLSGYVRRENEYQTSRRRRLLLLKML